MSVTGIAVVAFDRISPFHLSMPCAVFGERHPGLPPLRFQVCAVESGPIATTAGFSLAGLCGPQVLAEADVIIVPSWRDVSERPPEALLTALAAAAERGAQVVGLCLGAYVLAEAGLLDGRRATTHWAYAADFAARYPAVKVEPDVLYVEDGAVLTSAGAAAGIDCCLHMVRQRCGAAPANALARRLVVPPHRQGGQAQFIEQPMPATVRQSRLAELMDWVRATLDQPHDIDTLAARAAMSRRTFTRQFSRQTGTTVSAWLHGERLALTQRLLEGTGHSVERIAALAGFGSAQSLRLHFRRAFGVSPAAWRRSFRG